MRSWTLIAAASAATLPGIGLELGLYDGAAAVRAAIFGCAIVGAAFLLSWAAEALQVDVSQGLALGLLALIAVLPEYIVDATFAWQAAYDPAYAQYAVANMTGANRLLVGVAWPMVVAIGWIRFRRTSVMLDRGHGLEIVVLLVASVYAVTIPFKGEISLVDFVVLAAIFGFYLWRLSKLPAERPHLVGPAAAIAALATAPRRLTTAGVALVAAVVILFVAEPFAGALIDTGSEAGVDEFLLVQWLAPLASEAPEFVVVALFAWRGAATAAMGTLVSSKINQWTLLVGMLPVIYSVSLGGAAGLPLDDRQKEELFLTAAQTLAAVVFLLDLRFHWFGAPLLFGLFVAQFAWQDRLLAFAFVYFALALVAAVVQRRAIGPVLRDTRNSFRTTPSSATES